MQTNRLVKVERVNNEENVYTFPADVDYTYYRGTWLLSLSLSKNVSFETNDDDNIDDLHPSFLSLSNCNMTIAKVTMKPSICNSQNTEMILKIDLL